MKADIHTRRRAGAIDVILSGDGKPERWRTVATGLADTQTVGRAVGAALILAGYAVTESQS